MKIIKISLKLGKIFILVGVNFTVQYSLALASIDLPPSLRPKQLIAQNLSYEQALNAKVQAVTVIINGQNPGSGVVIGQQGNTYFVLTAKHVVAARMNMKLSLPTVNLIF